MRFSRPTAVASRAKVSVVVPCYRYGRYLPTAVHSVLSQEGVDVEVIVVDDASGDDSVAVARSLEADRRVRVVAHDANVGHIKTYNDGLSQVTGDYVVLLSADDALVPGALSRAVALLQANPRVGMVYGYSAPFTDVPPRIVGEPRSWTIWNGHAWLARLCRRSENPVSTPEVVMRRAAWDEIGSYDARVPHAADMLLWFRTSLRWDIGRVNGGAQALYRVHGENMHLTTYAGMLRDLREQREVFRLLFSGNDPQPADAARLHGAARRALARRALRLAAAEERDGGSPAVAAEYREFASQTMQDTDRPLGWSLRLVADAWLESRAAAPVRRVQRHLAWRRWRRYGL